MLRVVCACASIEPPLLHQMAPNRRLPANQLTSGLDDLRVVFSKKLTLSLPQPALRLAAGTPLPSSRLYQLSRPEHEAMDTYISESLASALIMPLSSPVGAAFLFVRKKDGTFRPCIDYLDLNDITVHNKYPVPLLNAAFAPLQRTEVFTKLDLCNFYNLVLFHNADECPSNRVQGHAIWTQDVLHNMLNKFLFFYLDDSLVLRDGGGTYTMFSWF